MSVNYSGALVQQGSIDWVALSKTTIGFSVELLARYSRAGVEALTIAVGQALFAQFSLPADAQRRLQLSVAKLKAYSSAANALWFGIGFKHLVRTLLETEQGATSVAVASSLMVSYSSEFSATVLKTLCDKSSLPEGLTPSLSQWGAFINICSSAVTASNFPILVEGFSRLLMTDANKRKPCEVVATSPSELAAALLEIAQLSTGKVANVTLMGNADCGWLAALAEWLFSLRVEIIDHTGNSLYQSKGGSQANAGSFQLTIIRLEDGQTGAPQSLLHSRTHLIPPGDLLFNLRTETPYHLFYQGRSEWSNILNDTFSSSFQRLLEPDIIPSFAQVLYSGLYVDDRAYANYRMNPWGDSLFIKDSMQHQQRFIQMLRFAAARLPELVELEKYGKDHAPELDRLDLDRPKRSQKSQTGDDKRQDGRLATGTKKELIYLGYSTALVDACSCGDCKLVDEIPSSQDTVPVQYHWCLSKIAVAVLEFISCLSWLDIDETIRPSSNGLASLCSATVSSPREIRNKYLNENPYGTVIKVLTGFNAQTFRNPSAVAMHGLCVYRHSLEDPNIGVDLQLRLRVVPGRIERNDKLYDQIDETSNPWLTYRDDTKVWGEEMTHVIAMLGANPLLQIAVEENTTSLKTKLLVSPEVATQIHWNSLYRPFLDQEVQTQYRQSCYLGAPRELFLWIKCSLQHIQCQKTHRSTERDPVWTTINGSVEAWSGRCSIAELSWWTNSVDGKLPLISKSNEWVVADYDEHDTLQIILGYPPLLYCLISRLGIKGANTFLVKTNDCLVCMGLGKDITKSRKPQKIFVHYHQGGQLQKFQFLARSDRMFVDTNLPT